MSISKQPVPPSTSPFSKTEFHDISEPYSREGSVFGLRQSNGKVIINFDHQTSYPMIKQIAKLTNTEIVTVKGVWTFTPEREKE